MIATSISPSPKLPRIGYIRHNIADGTNIFKSSNPYIEKKNTATTSAIKNNINAII